SASAHFEIVHEERGNRASALVKLFQQRERNADVVPSENLFIVLADLLDPAKILFHDWESRLSGRFSCSGRALLITDVGLHLMSFVDVKTQRTARERIQSEPVGRLRLVAYPKHRVLSLSRDVPDVDSDPDHVEANLDADTITIELQDAEAI